MTQIERRNAGILYIADETMAPEFVRAREIIDTINTLPAPRYGEIPGLLQKLFGKADSTTFLNPPFHCDYGKFIFVGEHFFANYNLTVLDVAPVTIGKYCQCGPNVSIYTAGHPIHPALRNTGYEFGKPVTIGDNVWIGANSVILPGVTIGSNTVIGAGSVVTKDIPDWCIAAGNPCRVLRRITEADREKWFKNEPIDDQVREALPKDGLISPYSQKA